MGRIWLVIKNKTKNYTFTKYFDTEFEKDKYKRKIKYNIRGSGCFEKC